MKHDKVIGVLGGMGHACTAHFFRLMVEYQQRVLNCVQDEDFYKSVIYNTALTDWNETGFVDKEKVKEQLIQEVKVLWNFPVDIIAIPCNTVHYFYKEMQDAVPVPIINMVEEVARKVLLSGKKVVGVISSRSTEELKLYGNRLSGLTVISCTDEEQAIVDNVILNVQAGAHGAENKLTLTAIIERMIGIGVRGIIIGCTELSIPLHGTPYAVFDSSQILVESLFKEIA
jgi:aspartate racemase